MSRDITNFRTYWRATTFSSILEPTIYLLAFGLGFGTLVSTVQGVDYVEFVATGTVATAVLFSSVFPAMFGVFVKHRFQRTYDAILAAPVDTEELVTAEILWISIRAAVYGMAPLLVAMAFGLDPSWGMLLVPFIGAAHGPRLRRLRRVHRRRGRSNRQLQLRHRARVITPLFLVSGTFFPIDGLPDGPGRSQPQPALPLRRARAACGLRLRDGRPLALAGAGRVRPRHLAPGRLAAPEAAHRLRRIGAPRSQAAMSSTASP